MLYRLLLLLCGCVAPLFAGQANFLGDLAHGFHSVTVLFRVCTIPLRDTSVTFCTLYPVLSVLLLPFTIHRVYLRHMYTTPSVLVEGQVDKR